MKEIFLISFIKIIDNRKIYYYNFYHNNKIKIKNNNFYKKYSLNNTYIKSL